MRDMISISIFNYNTTGYARSWSFWPWDASIWRLAVCAAKQRGSTSLRRPGCKSCCSAHWCNGSVSWHLEQITALLAQLWGCSRRKLLNSFHSIFKIMTESLMPLLLAKLTTRQHYYYYYWWIAKLLFSHHANECMTCMLLNAGHLNSQGWHSLWNVSSDLISICQARYILLWISGKTDPVQCSTIITLRCCN